MSRLLWDQRPYELGVDRGVFYPQEAPGVAWNGLMSVRENSTGSEIVSNYLDGQQFRQRRGAEEFTATVEAFTYPDEFEVYAGLDGYLTSQLRKTFGLSYRTMGENGRYKIHLVYNALAQPNENNHNTQDDNVDPLIFSWELSTRPLPVLGASPTAHMIIESNALGTTPLEDILYGTDDLEPRLPEPNEVLEIFESEAILRITDNGDGTWTAEGPDSVITMLDSTTFQIDWPSAVFIDSNTYTIRSL